MNLTVTVVIPTITGREWMLNRALESVGRQRRAPDDVIVEHDQERIGVAHMRNSALAKVDTDVIAWLDDDDELLPNHLSALMKVVERRTSVDLVYPIPRMNGGDDPTATSVNGRWVSPWHVPFKHEQELHLRCYGNFIPMTHVVRTDVVRRAGGFPIPGTPEWPRPNVEDWGYLIRLLDAGCRIMHLPIVTWLWHVHDAHTGGESTR